MSDYSDDYREGFADGEASARLVCGEQHAFIETQDRSVGIGIRDVPMPEPDEATE